MTISVEGSKLDTGSFLNLENGPLEIEKVLNGLSNAEKYDLLTSHVTPKEDVSKTPIQGGSFASLGLISTRDGVQLCE